MLKRFSLTGWLSLMFALVAVVTFGTVGAYLYESLAFQIQKRDDAELLGKLDLIRHLLSETPSIQTIQDNSHPFIDASAGREGFMVLLKSPDGRTLLQNEIDFGVLPVITGVSADAPLDDRALVTAQLESGTTARIAAAWSGLRDSSVQVQAIVARTGSERQIILTGYRNDVIISSLIGALVVALLGYLLVRKGFQPVRSIARQAENITAQRLEQRLDAGAAPVELSSIVEAFNAMLNRLQDSFLRLSQFSADLAHDMRTPINNLMVQTQVLLSKSRSLEDYQALMASNIEEYERLARMLDNMLFLARADDAKVTVTKKPLDARDELLRIAEYFEGVAEEANTSLQVDGSGIVFADPIMLRRAVSNLVANALRYTNPGSTVRLRAEQLGAETLIAVENTGQPIPNEHLPKLFDRFYRVDPSRTESSGSTGLGLAIVQTIMTLHEGHASVTSSVDTQKTVFQLFFPTVDQLATPVHHAPTASKSMRKFDQPSS